jgi:hypothetical protein
VSVQPFIEADRAGGHGTVKRAGELLEVSRAAYYTWLSTSPPAGSSPMPSSTSRIKPLLRRSGGTAVRSCTERVDLQVPGTRTGPPPPDVPLG